MCEMGDKHKLSMDFSLSDLYVEITNKCNLYCKYCCRNSGVDQTAELSAEVFDRLLSEAWELGCRNITLTGGEAMLHHDFEEMLKRCVYFGYDVHLLSNGLGLKNLSRHCLNQIKRVQISLDGGSAEENDQTRGAGSFEHIVSAIRYLLGEGMAPENISLKMTITHRNINGISSLIDLAANYGIMNVGFSFLYKAGRAVLEEDLFLKNEDKNDILDMLGEARLKYPDMNIQMPAYTDKCPLIKEKGKISLMPRISCTGKVYACQMFSDEFWIGDLSSDHLADLINGSRMEGLRTLAQSREIFMEECQTCALRKKCGKGCVAVSLFDGITATDGNCCLRENHDKEVRRMAVKWIRKQQELASL